MFHLDLLVVAHSSYFRVESLVTSSEVIDSIIPLKPIIISPCPTAYDLLVKLQVLRGNDVRMEPFMGHFFGTVAQSAS